MRLQVLPLFVAGELTSVICLAAGAIWTQAIDMRGPFRGRWMEASHG